MNLLLRRASSFSKPIFPINNTVSPNNNSAVTNPPAPPPPAPPATQASGNTSSAFSVSSANSSNTLLQAPPPAFSVNLSFDPSVISPGEAYARIVRLDNDERSITAKEQRSATEILESNLYKQTPLAGSNNIVFLSNPSTPAANESKAIREVEAMAAMPTFKDLFDELKNSGEKIVIMVSSYGTGFAAGNVNLTNSSGKKLNVITLDPDYVDYDHTNPYKRDVLTALSNELHEINSRVKESKQGVTYVATRSFQESTLAVDQVMEDLIRDFSKNNNVNFSQLSAQERSNVLDLMKNWSPQLFVSNLSKALNQANQAGSYSGMPTMTSYNAALNGLTELNKKLDYLLGTNRKVEFAIQQASNGSYSYVPVLKTA